MEKPKLRRTLYIGLGGTGIKVIKEVKKNFLNNSSQSLPLMVKFLCIDTNKGDLDGHTVEGTEKLSSLEKIFMKVEEPDSALDSGGSAFDWIPKSNRDSVIDIAGMGAGQVRSNGRFILENDCMISNQLQDRLTKLYKDIIHGTNSDENYDLLSTANIDVHLIFSLAGGTGSGMFLKVAQLIRRYIPKANLMAYAFSPSFFESVGVTWNITHNTYGALLELDYYMHGGKGKYTNDSMDITKKLFDSVMYIDGRTYTKNNLEDAYNYDFDEVKVIVAHALYLSAGEIGTNALSIVDNLRTAMNSGGYDVKCSNGIKGAWVSSLGVSEMVCHPKADVEYKTIESASNILKNILHGERVGLAMAEANKWIVDLAIDETKGEEDGNYLINRMLSPDAYSLENLRSKTKIIVNDNGEYDDSEFKKANDTNIKAYKENVDSVVDEKRLLVLKKIKEELFPTAGGKTIGVEILIRIIAGLEADILESKGALQSEISIKKENRDSIEEKIAKKAKDIVEEMKQKKRNRDDDVIDTSKNAIKKLCVDKYILQQEIDRRTAAIEVYDKLYKLLTNYVKYEDNNDVSGSGVLFQLKNNIEFGINQLNEDAKRKFGPQKITVESTSIDLTSRANQLPTSKTESNPVHDWDDFFCYTQYASVDNLAPKSDWDQTAVHYFKSKQSVSGLGPIIIRVLDTFSKEERIQKYKDLINRARPLMDISTFGELKFKTPTDFIFVSYPSYISENDEEAKTKLQEFRNEFEEALGSDKFEIIPQKDNNKILVYHQLGVIPPFYIYGISYQKNSRKYEESCEAKYLNYLKESSTNRKVKPFTDAYFEHAYENDGHSLDSEYQGKSKSKIDLWVDSFILGLVKRVNDEYSIVNEKFGEYDPLDEEERNWFNLDKSRKLAFEKFKIQKPEFFESLEENLSDLKQERAKLYDSFFNNSMTEKDRNKLYKTQYSLVDLSSEQDATADTVEMIKQEIISIKSRSH